jgi:hypothetical protein
LNAAATPIVHIALAIKGLPRLRSPEWRPERCFTFAVLLLGLDPSYPETNKY